MSILIFRAAYAAAFAFIATSTLAADFGRTTGIFDVSSGAATYAIPIWVPPGPNGVQPSIALSYNSQASNGAGGVGWSISGLSSISRCSRTIHQDGAPAPVDFSSNDRFCINGNRLRLASGTYGSSGSVYFTELADYSRITALTSPAGLLYFRVEAKSGMKYEYGYNADARTNANGVTLTWWLNKAYDRNGNNFVVSYTGSGGTPLPSLIQWTPAFHGASTYKYSMAFSYLTTRIDFDSLFMGANGHYLANRGLLKNIIVSREGTTLRNYVLSHTTSSATSRSLLTSVKECADAAVPPINCLLPLNFTYQAGVSGLNPGAGTAPPGSSDSLQARKHDFNGDGRDDVAYKNGTTWWVASSTSNGFTSPINTGALHSNGMVIGRFLPNGRHAFAQKIGGALWLYRWDDGISNFIGSNTGVTLSGPIGLAADANGDKLDDLVTVNPSGTGLQVRLNTSSGSSNASFSSTLTPTATLPSGWLYTSIYTRSNIGLDKADVNADGRDDLYASVVWPGDFPPTGSDVNSFPVLASGAGYVVPPTAQWIGGANGSFSNLNFNGDPCTDRVLGATLYISDCKGGVAATRSVPAQPLEMLDWDGDGRTDLLVENGGTFGIHRSTGNGFSTLIGTAIASSTDVSTPDLDGDGLEDLVKPNGAFPFTYWTHTASGFAPASATHLPDLLSNVTDGFGVHHSPSYVSTAWSNYSQGDASNYPLQGNAPSLVVSQVQSSNGIAGTYTRTFHYAGSRIHATRRENVGFQRLEETDSRSGIISKTYFEQVFPKSGMVEKFEVLQPNGVDLISRAISTNSSAELDSTTNNQRHFVFNSSRVETTYGIGAFTGAILGTTTTTSLYENVGGTLYDETVTTEEPVSGANGITAGGIWTKRVYLPIANLTNELADWCLGRPGRTEVSASHNLNFGGLITRVSTSVWESSKCRPTQTVEEPGNGTHAVTTTLGYDNFGNVSSTTVTGAGMQARTTAASYTDSVYTTGQFPLSITNALQQSKTLT